MSALPQVAKRLRSLAVYADKIRIHVDIGQRKDKFCTNTFCADDIDIFMMGMYDFFNDGQPKTGSLFVFPTGSIRFIKTFPDTSDTFLWNPDSLIFD